MNKLIELLAAMGVGLVLVGVPLVVYCYEQARRAPVDGENLRTFTLTGVARDGVWTDETVAGHNYWRRRFHRATIRVRVGERVLLRLRSADVTHSFSCPELGIERVEVKVGFLEEVVFNAESPGTYLYYCDAVCGDCHYYMRGVIEVLPQGTAAPADSQPGADLLACAHDIGPPAEDDLVAQGEYLYRKLGCIACHEGPGVGTGINAPADLHYEGNKVRPEWLVAFLLEPAAMRWRSEGLRPFIDMPNLQLTEPQAQSLAAYLAQKTDTGMLPPSGLDWDSPVPDEEIEQGRLLYEQYQCQGCHALDGVGRKVGPSHDGVGSRLRPDYMYRWLLDPQQIVPGTSMPNKGLWEEEAQALVRYLQTLKGNQ